MNNNYFRPAAVAAACVLVIIFSLLGNPRAVHSGSSDALLRRFPTKYHVRMDVSLTRNTFRKAPAGEYEIILLCPIPTSNQYHDVGGISVNQGKILPFGNGDNRVLVVSAKNGLPDKITVEYDISVYRIHADFEKMKRLRPYDTSAEEYKKNTGGTDGFEVDHPKIRQMSDGIWKESRDPLDYARRCFEAIQKNFKWKTTGRYGNISEIFGNRGGDCGALSNLFVTLMKSRGIPARLIVGGMLEKNEYGTHVWPEFYLEGYGWIPLDPSVTSAIPCFGYFGGNYLGFHRGSGFSVQAGERQIKMGGLQRAVDGFYYTGGRPSGEYKYETRFKITLLKKPEAGGYYNSGDYPEKRTRAFLRLVNDTRQKKGLAPYRFSQELSGLLRERLRQEIEKKTEMDLSAAMAGIGYFTGGMWMSHLVYGDMSLDIDRYVGESMKPGDIFFKDAGSEIAIGYYYDSGQGQHHYSVAGTDPIGPCKIHAKNIGLKPGQTLVVKCPGNCSSEIWGTDTYTSDSAICVAARHAGVIGAGGGRVRVTAKPGQKSYSGTERNGIKSSGFGSYEGSYSVSRD